MANEKVKANVNGGAGGSRWAKRAVVKAAAKKVRRTNDKAAVKAAE